MDYKEHKEYFETAYRTGSDIWTHIPTKERGEMLTNELPKGALILDVGSGRGLFAKQLAENGYSVIGIDFEPNIVKRANEEIKNWDLQGKLRFVEGDALDIPFTDESFDGVYSFGLMENLYKDDWTKYASEIIRVLRPGGFYLNVSMSRETQQFLGFNPKGSDSGDFERYGIHYYFFNKEEVRDIFTGQLDLIEQKIESVESPDKISLLASLFRKKK